MLVSETSTNVFTDENGRYSIKIPADKKVVIRISLRTEAAMSKVVGPYETGTKNFKIFRFSESTSLKTAVVKGQKDRDKTLIKLDPRKLDRFVSTGGFEQVLKTAAIGISSAGGELSSGYSVRGGNFDENLVYVNDIEVYRPFLVRSGQQEGLSVINPDLVENVDFSAGGFAAQYGDKLSSVLDIRYREPTKFASTFQASLLGANVHVEDKILDGRVSYLIGARFRSNQYLLGTLETQGDYNPRFFDLQTVLNYKINKEWTLSYLTTLSQNRFELVPQNRQTSFGSFNTPLSLFINFGGGELMEYTTWMNGLNLSYKPSQELNLNFIASSYISSEREHFTVEGAYTLSELDNNLGSEDFGETTRVLGRGYFIDNARNDLQAQVYTASHKGKYITKKSTVRWGAGFVSETIDDRLNEWRYNDSSEYNITTRATGSDQRIELDEVLKSEVQLQSFRVNAYVQNTRIINPRKEFKATYGVRTNFWSLNGENVISPRLQFSWQRNKPYNDSLKQYLKDSLKTENFDYSLDTLDKLLKMRKKRDWLFRFAGGYYYQPPFYRELRGIDGSINEDLRAQRSIHAVFGGDLNFEAWGRPFKFITEVYYKHLDRMVPYIVDNVRIRYLADNISQGYSTGIDARVNGEFIEGIESWLNVSVMQTQERLYFTDENGQEQLSDWLRRPTDQRVNFSILFQDELPSNPSYKMNLSLIYGTKMPFFYDGVNRQREGFNIPAYRRVDVGFSKVVIDSQTKKKPNWLKNAKSLWVSLEVFNLLQVNNTISFLLVKDFANTVYGVPNYLTGRRVNLRFILRI